MVVMWYYEVLATMLTCSQRYGWILGIDGVLTGGSWGEAGFLSSSPTMVEALLPLSHCPSAVDPRKELRRGAKSTASR